MLTSNVLIPLDSWTSGLLEYKLPLSKPVPNTFGKSPAIIQKLIDQSGQPDVSYGSAAPHTDEFVSSSVTPTPNHEFQDYFDAIQGGNAQTCRASERYVILTSSFKHLETGVNISPRVGFSNSHVQMEIGDTVVAPVDNTKVVSTLARDTRATSLPRNGVRTSFVPGNEAGGSSSVSGGGNMIDHVSPPGFWASLRNRHDLNFLDLLNVSSAQYVSMVSELRLWYEHEILIRGKFEQKFTQSSEIVQQRGSEIVALKAKVGEVESVIAEVNGLRGRISELEAAAIAKSEEVAGLSDAEAQRFKERSAELDARIMELNHDMDAELYPHMLTVVARQRWVFGHDFHLAVMKCAQSIECRAALGKVIYMAINKGIQEGLEAGIEHGKPGRSL
ncbi:hypothetical protein Tco_0863461, partial [Tanacetum coccineum]